jgi:hypothetical protein
MPVNGTVVRLESHVSIFCTPCERWIDCHDGIEPQLALDRHGALMH